jgi:general secretion pathway protein C
MTLNLPRASDLPGILRVAAVLALAAGAGVWGAILLAPAPASLPPALRSAGPRAADTSAAALLFGKNEALKTQVTVAGVISAGANGAAVLSVDGGPPLAWRAGQEVAPGLQLVRVEAAGVVLDQNGTQATLTIPALPDAPGSITAAPEAVVARRAGR